MGELKNRKYLTSTVPNEQVDKLNELSKNTMIAKSKLMETALNLLFDKYKNPTK